MAPRPRVLIAHRRLIRAAIVNGLEDECEVCAEASNAEEAIAAARASQPDVCLVGSEIPGDGIRAVRGICEAASGARIIVLAEARDVDDLFAAIRAGAIGYAPREVTGEQLRRIIRAVLADEAAVPRSMVRDLMLELRTATGRRTGRMTGREAQVLGMLRRGHSTAAIAQRLEISPVTVRRHIAELVQKLGVENRAALMADAGRPGRRTLPYSTISREPPAPASPNGRQR